MKLKLTFFLIIFSFTYGFSQVTESPSIMESEDNYLKYDASKIQLKEHMELNTGILMTGRYDLENLASGLFLRPENFSLDSPFLRAYGNGYTLKYYIGSSNFYLTGGPQAIIFSNPESGEAYNIGVNIGMGYDLSPNTQIEGRIYQSLDKNYDQNAFQPVQMVPLQPISLGFKTKF